MEFLLLGLSFLNCPGGNCSVQRTTTHYERPSVEVRASTITRTNGRRASRSHGHRRIHWRR